MSEKPATKNRRQKTGDKFRQKKLTKKTQGHRNQIMVLIAERGEVTAAEVCQELGLKVSQVRQILSSMVAESLIEAEGANKSRRYRTKK